MRWCFFSSLLFLGVASASAETSRDLFERAAALDKEAQQNPERSKELQQQRCELLKDSALLTSEEAKPNYNFSLHAAYCFFDIGDVTQAELMSRMFLSLAPPNHELYKAAELFHDFCKTNMLLSALPQSIVIDSPIPVSMVPSSGPASLPALSPPSPVEASRPRAAWFVGGGVLVGLGAAVAFGFLRAQQPESPFLRGSEIDLRGQR